jgi:membrane protein implicated in regulation of membrane protease activity
MEIQGNYVRALQILYKALLGAQLFFAAILIILFATGGLAGTITVSTANIFIYVALAIAVLSVGMSYKVFNQKAGEAKRQNDLTDKLNGYRAAVIMQLALCEGPGLVSIIFYFLTAIIYF